MSEAPNLLPTDRPATTRTDAATSTVPIIEERAVVGVEHVQTGRIRLERTVDEKAELIQLPLKHDEVRVERVPVGRVLEAGAETPAPRYEGDTYIVPVLREQLEVITRLVLVEELHVTRKQHEKIHTEIVQLRRENISVERLPGDVTLPPVPGPIEPAS